MEREILVMNLIDTGYGTHKYDVKYSGEWDDWALVNCVDTKKLKPTEEEYEAYNQDCGMNYGGAVNRIYSKDGITRAIVAVYYD